MTLCFYKSQQSLESDGQAALSYHITQTAMPVHAVNVDESVRGYGK